ncbi:hypothetical protein CLU79DRAFT_761167 [Phycomyces nitens]|nr:hypothetical protein CLU79DRAFT_761167 [Phycomyces nitens]
MADCLGSMLCVHYIKHANLINQCYPDREGEKGPRSSELSYLLFYASNRPVKLTKVGSYLERKVERDIRKGRRQNNQVSLDILKALIQECHSDLNLFSKYIIAILTMILNTRDIDLIDLTCETFIVFCDYHDGTTLGVDQDFTTDFEALIGNFAAFCNYTNADDSVVLRMRYTGYRALQACVTSNALHVSDMNVQLDLIIPPLLTCLSTSTEPIKDLVQEEGSVDIRRSAKDIELNQHIIERLAAQTLSMFYNKPNGPAIRLSLAPVFRFLDANDMWWPRQFAVSLMDFILNSLQPQHRYLLVSEVLQQLETPKAARYKDASLAAILDVVLSDPLGLVGISVLEVLNAIFGVLIQSIRSHGFREHKPEKTDTQGIYEFTIHRSLVHCVGGLASHTYYQNQQKDMVGYIISKLRVSTTLDTVNGMPLETYRRVALVCLDRLLCKSTDEVSFDTWIPALGLLSDKVPGTRLAFASTMTRFLSTDLTRNDSKEALPDSSLRAQQETSFIHNLHKAFLEWALVPDLTPSDAVSMYRLLCTITRRFGASGTIQSVPFIFELQRYVQDKKIKTPHLQRTIAAVLVEYLSMVGVFHGIPGLVTCMDAIRQERMVEKEYTTVVWIEAPEDKNVMNFEEVELNNKTPVSHFIDRNKVIDFISVDERLKDKEDIHGLNMEKRLRAEWGSEALISHEPVFRISVPKDFEEIKPKLEKPWESPCRDPIEPEEKQSIRVENLKEVLGKFNPKMNKMFILLQTSILIPLNSCSTTSQ